MGSTRPMWVGLDLCDGLGWVEFFLTYHGGLGKKILLTRPMHTLSSISFHGQRECKAFASYCGGSHVQCNS